MIRIKTNSSGENATDCSGARATNIKRRLSVSALVFGWSFVSIVQSLPTCAAEPTTTALPAPTGGKQIAAVEIPTVKDATTTTGSVAPTAPAITTPSTLPAATPGGAAPVAPPATNSATTSATPAAVTPQTDDTSAADASAPKMLLKKGQPLIVVPIETEDVQPTDDVNLAKEQAQHFPDSAEAAFILAVALTRTSRVEEALAEVRVARKLANAAGGPAYFDKMIKSYEEMLQSVDDPRVRYSLAWAYYMKAYLLAQDSHKAMANPQVPAPVSAAGATSPATGVTAPVVAPAVPPVVATVQPPGSTTPAAPTAPAGTAAAPAAPTAPAGTAAAPAAPLNTSVPTTISAKAEKKKVDSNMAMTLLAGLNPDIAAKMNQQGGKIPAAQLPLIPTAISKAAPSAVPQIHQYYGEALKNLDAILVKNPNDVWALLYRWHLYAEETGNLSEAMKQWKDAERRFPMNPGVQFFLGEGYLKEGNLKEAIFHASKAIFLRGAGN